MRLNEDWEYKRGDIYLADLNPVIGAELGGVRPVLVLQNNVGNHYAPTLIVVPMTSNILKKPKQPTHFLLKKTNGLSMASMVILEQIKTLDKRRIIKYMGKVDHEILESPEFLRCISVSLALNLEAITAAAPISCAEGSRT